MYLFDFHSKNENGNLSSFGIVVLIKFDTLYSLENYVRSVYYNTLYIHAQFIKVDCTATAKSAIKYELKKEHLSAKREKDFLAKKMMCYEKKKRKRRHLKRDIMIRANQ